MLARTKKKKKKDLFRIGHAVRCQQNSIISFLFFFFSFLTIKLITDIDRMIILKIKSSLVDQNENSQT